jgi:hypothetical protein
MFQSANTGIVPVLKAIITIAGRENKKVHDRKTQDGRAPVNVICLT